ncbi:MAG TPA: RidA family protein [Bdellovibrionales bacterium]|nr:RidA family protein [Bdellovibrionales bacterium]
MFKKIFETKKAPAPIGPYSQAVESGGFLFCSGQIPLDPASGQIVTGGVPEQTEMVMQNIEAVLSEAKLGFENIVKTTIFLTDMADFPAVNEVYGRRFKSEPPARSTVAVQGLPRGVKVEIEVLARRP